MKYNTHIILSVICLSLIFGCTGIKLAPIESDCTKVEIVFDESPKKLKHGKEYTFRVETEMTNNILIAILGITGSLTEESKNTYTLRPLSKGIMELRFIYEDEETNKKKFLCSVKYQIY